MEDRHGLNRQQQCAYNNEENNSQRQNNIAKDKRKGEFSIESILLAKSNQQSKILFYFLYGQSYVNTYGGMHY